jgi:hypothetical protein
MKPTPELATTVILVLIGLEIFYILIIDYNIIGNIPVLASVFHDTALMPPVRDVPLNLTMCDRVWSQYMRDACYRKTGVSMGNYTICDKIRYPNDRDMCYHSNGMAHANQSLCEKVSDRQLGKYCAAVVQKNQSICGEIPDINKRNPCFVDVAAALNDTVVCAMITDSPGQPKYKDKCLNATAG